MSAQQILIIFPTSYYDEGRLLKQKKATMPNLSILYLAGLVPDRHKVSIVDESVSDIDFSFPADLVAVSVITPNAKRAYEVADRFRAQGKTVVLGGIHASCQPEEAAAHADAVVIGEADILWPQLIADHEAGRLRKLYQSAEKPELNNLPHPRFDLVDRTKYIHPPMTSTPIIPIQTSRGCPHACDFCSVTEFWGSRLRFRPIPEIIEEVKLSGARTVFFTDDNFMANPKRTAELCRALIPLKIKYICQLSSFAYKHPELVKLLADSGCVIAFVGFESVSRQGLEAVNKGFNKPAEYGRLFDLLTQHGIHVYASIILGLDGDDEHTVAETVGFLRKQRASIAAFFPLIPTPGTKLYDRLREQGRLYADSWWLSDDHTTRRVRIRYGDGAPTGLQLMTKAMRAFYSPLSILGRYFPYRRNGLLPFVMNLEIALKLKVTPHYFM